MSAELLGPEQLASRIVREQITTAEVSDAAFGSLAEQIMAAYPNVPALSARTIVMNALDNRF